MRIDQQVKQQLARELCAILDGWTLVQAVSIMHTQASHISELRNGKLAGFSIARLLRLIATHGYDVELLLRPRKPAVVERRVPTATVVRYDRLGQPVDLS